MSDSTGGADGSEKSEEISSLSSGSKTESTEHLTSETVSKPVRPPPPSRSQTAKSRPRPPPPVRSMTLGGVPKAAEVARARAKARASLNLDASESQFSSVRHLISPPPVEQREVFSFDKERRGQRARSFSPSDDADGQSSVVALNKARNRKSLSPDSGLSHSLASAKEMAEKGSAPKSVHKDSTNQSKSEESVGETSPETDSSKSSSSSTPSTPPKRPPRPYAPPIFEAKVARKRPPPVPHVIDIRDSSPQMIKSGKAPPVPRTTIVDTRNQSESPKRPPLPVALAQSGPKKVASKDDSTVPVPATANKKQGQDEAKKPEATPTHKTPVVRFASPPPTSSSSAKTPSSSKTPSSAKTPSPSKATSSKTPSSLKPAPPVQDNSVSDKQDSKTSGKESPPRPAPTVRFNLEDNYQASDVPTSAAATKATPTPSQLSLTQPDSESGTSLSSPVEDEEFGSFDGVVASGKSPSPSRSRRFIKSMKASFRHMKRKRPNEGEQRGCSTVCNRSNTLPPPGHEEDASTSNRQQPTRAHTVYAGAHHDNHVYDKDKYPDELPQGIIDPVIVKAIAYLNKEQVLLEEGLFRIPGDLTAIKSLRARFTSGEDVDLNEVLDPHTIAGLLKVHFREMRVSIIPRGSRLAELIKSVQTRDVQMFSGVIATIEPHHLATIRMLAEVLAKIAANSSKNRMTSGTLATSCGPSIFPYLPPSNANAIIKFLVDHCDEIFTE